MAPDNENKNNNKELVSLFQKDLEIREKELENRDKELEIQKENNQRNYEQSKDLIERNFILIQNEQAQKKTGFKYSFWLMIFLTLCVFVFSILCILFNKENVLIEFAKYAAIVFGSGGIGYTIGFKKAKKSDPIKTEETS